MFEEAGYRVVSLEPVSKLGLKARALNALTGNRFWHLFVAQMLVEAQVVAACCGPGANPAE
jgi:hypothetical protein